MIQTKNKCLCGYWLHLIHVRDYNNIHMFYRINVHIIKKTRNVSTNIEKVNNRRFHSIFKQH